MKRVTILALAVCTFGAHAFGQQDSTYFFQHRTLPILYYEASEDLRSFLAGPTATLGLTALSTLRDGEALSEEAYAYAATIDSYRVERIALTNYEIFIITPPRPYKTPLCYLIGIVYPKEAPGPLPLGYFTLERGAGLDGKPYNPLCAWVVTEGNLNHLNYGDKGITDNRSDFLQKMVVQLTDAEEASGGITINRKRGTGKVLDRDGVQKQAKRDKKKRSKEG